MNQKTEKALNEQIKKEEFSSRLYMAMASWCEANGYPGASVFLYEHSEEERMHMLKMIHYVNDRGAHAQLLDIEAPKLEYNSLLEIFSEILVHEKYITNSINEIYQVAIDEKDYTTSNFLQWYITEQVEEESLFSTILDRIKLVGNDKAGMFHIDKELEGMAAGSSNETA